MVQHEELVLQIKDWVRSSPQATIPAKTVLSEETDLIASGILDSMGFIELLVFVESVTGQKIDLSGLDSDKFTSIEGLSRSILNGNSKSA